MVMMTVVVWWVSGGGGKWRVRESGSGDRVDRPTRSLFGLAGKIPPEKFSGGGSRWPAVGESPEKKGGEGELSVGEGYTRPVFGVKEIDHGEEEVLYWTTHASWKRLPKGGDDVWHIRMELIDPDGKKFKRVFRTMSITRKLSEKNKPSDILDLDHLYDS
ncbi:hypothetical protein Tco_0964167 [Tanacetum coccineum]